MGDILTDPKMGNWLHRGSRTEGRARSLLLLAKKPEPLYYVVIKQRIKMSPVLLGAQIRKTYCEESDDLKRSRTAELDI